MNKKWFKYYYKFLINKKYKINLSINIDSMHKKISDELNELNELNELKTNNNNNDINDKYNTLQHKYDAIMIIDI